MFDNIEKKVKIAPTQTNTDGEVAKKSHGRPRLPEMATYQVRLGIVLQQKAKDFCKEAGVSISSFIGLAIEEKLNKTKQKKFSKEDVEVLLKIFNKL